MRKAILPLVTKHSKFLSLLNEHISKVPCPGRITLETTHDIRCKEILIQNKNKLGSISAPMFIDLAHILDSLYFDEDKQEHTDLVGLIVRGTGDYFSAGLDLRLAKSVINTPERGIYIYFSSFIYIYLFLYYIYNNILTLTLPLPLILTLPLSLSLSLLLFL